MEQFEREIEIPIDNLTLMGNLNIPQDAGAIVVFAHGSGSSRFSPRNKFVAGILNDAGLATLLFDLLTEDEERIDMVTGELRFNIDLLAKRLIAVTDWIEQSEVTRELKLGYFGASTGAAAALIAAAERPAIARAVVSRGGRPDLAIQALSRVEAPTLLIVGGDDEIVIELNKQAMLYIPETTVKELKIVGGATHLFEEPGKLEVVANLAKNWFIAYLGAAMPGAERGAA